MRRRLTCQNAAHIASQFIETIPECPNHFRGRGIVICAGGFKYNPCAWVLVRLLRHLGCQLPIEIWYLGSHECDARWIELISQYDVQCIDAQEVRKIHPHPGLKGWPIKPYAILHSRFEEVLFIDADNVPVKDPAFLFENEQYKKTGAVFWPDPDQFKTPSDSKLWQVFGVPYRPGPAQESGQILINKSRCWRALNLCNWYNENSDFYYKHVYGDKDTFRFAWQRLQQPVSWIPTPVSEELTYTLVQHDFDGHELFQHRFFHKWSLFQKNPRIEGFQHEDLCLSFLKELREKWSPEKNLICGISQSDKDQMSHLSGQQFVLERVGYSRWRIEFGDNCHIVRGATKTVKFWWIRCGSLVFATPDGRRNTTLRKNEDGTWEGRTLQDKRIKLRLKPT